jgi:hypothetical protein
MTAKTVIAINLIISVSIIQIYTFFIERFSKATGHSSLNVSLNNVHSKVLKRRRYAYGLVMSSFSSILPKLLLASQKNLMILQLPI